MATHAEAATEVRIARQELEIESRQYFVQQSGEVEKAAQRLMDESLIVFWLATLSQQPAILAALRETSGVLWSAIDESVYRSFLAGWERNGTILDYAERPSGIASARQHSESRATAAVSLIERTTRRELEDVVVRTMEKAGIGLWDAATTASTALFLSAIANKYRRWRSYRSLLIARTETDNALEWGKFALAQQAELDGWRLEKFWRTMRDDRVEPICRGNEGAGWIPLRSQFPTGHLHPLAHVGCRCWLLYRWVARP